MIIFKNVGRLGNYLFELAHAAAYAWDHGMEFTVPTKTNDPKWNPIYLQHLANPKYDPSLPGVRVVEGPFHWQAVPFEEGWRNKNIVLDGYWQTEKYFKHHRERLLEAFALEREAFALPWELFSGWVSVHVRRGDYLTIKKNGQFKHPPVSKEWYENAMRLFPGFQFMFFSDDLTWCRENFGDRDDCEFPLEVPGMRALEISDLFAGSQCEHHISSASTFSWWVNWLGRNENKKVIIPKHWLSPGWGGIDTRDVVPPEWIRM